MIASGYGGHQHVIICLLREKNLVAPFDPEMWKDNLVAQKILSVSKSTLLRVRDKEDLIISSAGNALAGCVFEMICFRLVTY